MFKYIVLLAALVPAILATEGVSQCRSGAKMPTIDVTGCAEAPCPIEIGSKAEMAIKFTSRKN